MPCDGIQHASGGLTLFNRAVHQVLTSTTPGSTFRSFLRTDQMPCSAKCAVGTGAPLSSAQCDLAWLIPMPFHPGQYGMRPHNTTSKTISKHRERLIGWRVKQRTCALCAFQQKDSRKTKDTDEHPSLTHNLNRTFHRIFNQAESTQTCSRQKQKHFCA